METLEGRIKRFLNISSGSGYGSCYGSGSGDGDGYGYGDGYGSGYGSGYGYGDGSGSGSGYGSGDGYGYGSGIKSFNGQRVYIIDGVQTLIDDVHGNVAKGHVLHSDLTLNPCFIVKQDNLFAHGETLHKAYEALRSKLFHEYPEETRIAKFKEQYPDFNKKIPAMELFEWHNRLTGSCEMGRRSFARDHGIDIDKDEFTVNEFIRLTENSYGGATIRKLCAIQYEEIKE